MISEADAVARIEPASLDQLLHPMIDPKAPRKRWRSACRRRPGAACGEIVFSADEAEQARNIGRKVILVRVETSPEDIHGMHAAEGIVTTRGGMTSHAAVVARGMGKPCVSGAGTIRVDYAAQTMIAGGVTLKKGDMLTIDGGNGQVLQGAVPMVKPELTGEFATLMGWADAVRRMKVRANAETPNDARVARSFGAEGIGLCRTEHMFFEGERIVAVREMILSETEAGRRAALAKLLPIQRRGFRRIVRDHEWTAGDDPACSIRHCMNFCPIPRRRSPKSPKSMGVSADKLRARAADLHEFNPMLGFRGVRIAIRYPEIAEMQARAIFEGAVEAGAKTGQPIKAEIMVPLVMTKAELDVVKANIVAMAEAVAKETGVAVPYEIGTMIELPRAALRAGEIAKSAEFFLVRHQRPHADDARRFARRRRFVPRDLYDARHPAPPIPS